MSHMSKNNTWSVTKKHNENLFLGGIHERWSGGRDEKHVYGKRKKKKMTLENKSNNEEEPKHWGDPTPEHL